MANKLSVLFATFEAEPFAKTGGLGDVCGSLPLALNGIGCDVRVIMPKYQSIPEVFRDKLIHLADFRLSLSWRNLYCGIETLTYDGVIFYFIDNEYYYKREMLYSYNDDGERTAFFSKAVIESLRYMDWMPDIIHCHDWHAALIPVFLRADYSNDKVFSNIKTVLTIHNLKFQGICNPNVIGDVLGISGSSSVADALRQFDTVNYLRGGLICCDRITTVSPSYADEICTEYYGERQQDVLNSRRAILSGILNGIDTVKYNPLTDTEIYQTYDSASFELKSENKRRLQNEFGLEEAPDKPLSAIISRLTEQKGLDLVIRIINEMINTGMQLAVIGIGDPVYENAFINFSNKYPGNITYLRVFDEHISQKIYAGADMILIPSKFEPCGLTQMISMRYGTVPIVRETGGLRDSVVPYNKYTGEGSGFSFTNYNAHELLDAIHSAEALYRENRNTWNRLAKHCMTLDFSWAASAEKYKTLYKTLII